MPEGKRLPPNSGCILGAGSKAAVSAAECRPLEDGGKRLFALNVLIDNITSVSDRGLQAL